MISLKNQYVTVKIVTLSLIAAAAALPFDAAHSKTTDLRMGFSEVAKEATDAVVFIKVEREIKLRGRQGLGGMYHFFGDEFARRFYNPRSGLGVPGAPQSYRQSGQGSGFIISKDGYILTNTHVVGDMDTITVKLTDGREFSAKRIGADKRTEVALIKIETEEDLPFLRTGDVDALDIGQWVIAIGNPFGLSQTLTVGVVSAKGRSDIGITDYEDFIQTDAAINPGNSGGPLLNIEGEVVGINTAIYSQSGGYMGIGFAVPIDMALSIKDQLVANGYVKRGYIGVYLNPGEVTREMAVQFGHDEAGGALVADVLEDGPAAKAGIKSGDIIIELDGVPVKNNSTFRNSVARILPDKKTKLTVVRDGKRKSVTVQVGLMPDDERAEEQEEQVIDKLGFRVQRLTEEIAAELGYSGEEGLVVTEVTPGSEAQKKGLKAGMLVLEVNRREVSEVNDFEKAVRESREGSVLLRVKAGPTTMFLSLRVS
jgi:serine protease Do